MIECVVRRTLGYLALVVGLTAGPAGPTEYKNVKVTVVCILAEDGPPHIDPRLIHVAKEIQKKRPEWKCFRVKCMGCKSLEADKPHKFQLADGQEVRVVVKRPADKKNCVVLEVQPPLQGAFEYETLCGKFLPIITRYETPTGQRLILAICAQPCSGGK